MKAELIFSKKITYQLKLVGSVTIYMDCYKIPLKELRFENNYRFSFIAFDPQFPERRVLVDQHPGRPCHLHIDDLEIETEMPSTLSAAIKLFEAAVLQSFGEPR